MKTYILQTIVSVLILAGCSSTKNTADYDDVYYSTRAEKQQTKQQNQKEMSTTDPDYYTESEDVSTDYYIEDYEAGEYATYEQEPYYSEDETVETPEGTNYITNNYYGSGYDDYSYASRINRFYSPYSGFGYYSPCYAGFYYSPWYYDPYWYMPSFYFGMSWGWGSFGYGYPYYYPYNNYWYGYNHGYWDGYYASNYYDYGYNSYYYGHRPNRGSSNSSSNNTGTNGYTDPQRASSYETGRPNINSGITTSSTITRSGDGGNAAVRSETGQTSGTVSRPSTGTVSAAARPTVISGASGRNISQNEGANTSKKTVKPRYTYKKPAESSTSATRSKYQPGESIGNSGQYSRTQPVQKYNKPSGVDSRNNVTSGRKTTTSGKNSQVYSKPRTTSKNTYSKPARYNTSKKTTTQPSNSSRNKYSQPSRTNTRSYSTPSKSNSSRSYSSPSRSSGSKTYSTPSRSNSSRSYSAPSRSSGSSGSRSSSSGSRSSSSGSSSRGRR